MPGCAGVSLCQSAGTGRNKIALGHHFSDVIETTLMALLYGAQLQAMPPKLHSRNFPGMELIRPLYCVHEDDIIAWKNYNRLQFLQCACRFTEARDASGDGVGQSKRQEIKVLIRELKRRIPMWRSRFLPRSTVFNWTPWWGVKFGEGNTRFGLLRPMKKVARRRRFVSPAVGRLFALHDKRAVFTFVCPGSARNIHPADSCCRTGGYRP